VLRQCFFITTNVRLLPRRTESTYYYGGAYFCERGWFRSTVDWKINGALALRNSDVETGPVSPIQNTWTKIGFILSFIGRVLGLETMNASMSYP
jgi:hypothetical protein